MTRAEDLREAASLLLKIANDLDAIRDKGEPAGGTILTTAELSAVVAEAQQETASLVLRKAYDALGAPGVYPNDQWDSILVDLANGLGVKF